MFHFSSRTKLPTRLIGCFALAIVGAAALSTPASASKQSAVVAACKHMGSACSMTTSNGVVSGCTAVTCFWCEKGKCTHGPARVSEGNRYPNLGVEGNRNMMSPGLFEGGGSFSTNAPSATGQAIGGGSRGSGAAGVR